MKEILLTSSVLILALLLLRLLFRKTISRQVQYALWGLVALRLLVPVSLPAMEHNVLTAAEPVTARITDPEKAGKYVRILYNQACLIAGLPISDPSGYTDLLCSLWQ